MLWALIFARWVGAGVPFPAIPALALVTFANLGKLFAEAIEDIDAGPVEALQAAGAARLQQLRFGILPQVLLPFLSFGIYFWDITVRMSTVVGFVSGAGIGARLKEWMNGFQYRSAAVAILAIILMVTAMDTLSARIRARLR
jgi:phosphonate transport system permease protein